MTAHEIIEKLLKNNIYKDVSIKVCNKQGVEIYPQILEFNNFAKYRGDEVNENQIYIKVDSLLPFNKIAQIQQDIYSILDDNGKCKYKDVCEIIEKHLKGV